MASRNALPADFERIIQLVEAGTIDTQPWITHRCASTAFVETLPQWLDPKAQVLKAMIEF
jgi:alcohol dehydrogenase